MLKSHNLWGNSVLRKRDAECMIMLKIYIAAKVVR